MSQVNDRTTRRLALFVWVMAAAVILAGWLISYSSLRLLALVVGGYSDLEAMLYPLPIDFTLGGAVAAEFLLARWGAPRRPRLYVGLQVLLSACATVGGNAIHGLIAHHVVEVPWWGSVAVSAVPGAAIALMTHAATIMLRHRPPEAQPAPARASRKARDQAPRRRDPRSSSPVELADGRKVSAGHARKLAARRRRLEVIADAQ